MIKIKKNLYANLSRDNPKHAKVWRFIDEYPKDLNGTQAAIRAGYAARSADSMAAQLLGNIRVKQEVDLKLTEIQNKCDVDSVFVLKRWKAIAEVDVRKFSELHIVCCHYCWDEKHRYQYTPAELDAAEEKHDLNEERLELTITGYQAKPFNERGGATYNGKLKPHPECPECFGYGERRVIFNDTRNVSDDEAIFFDGVEIGKDGIKFSGLSRDGALDKLARHLGLYEKDNELSVKMPSEEVLDALYWTGIRESRALQCKVLEERGLLEAE